MKKPRILFAIGDIDWKYTHGKLRHLVKRVADAASVEVAVASHDKDVCQAFDGELDNFHMPGAFPSAMPKQVAAMGQLMIRYTNEVMFPGTRFPLWKTMATDDYVGCFTAGTHPPLPFRPDVIVYPLMGIDNNTVEACHFYAAVAQEARTLGVPVLGLEVASLGNRQNLGASLADYYGVKTDFTRSFVEKHGLAPIENAFILPPLESYMLTCRADPFLDEYFPVEKRLREILKLPQGCVTVMIPHNVAFVYETRRILAGLSALRFPVDVVLAVTPDVARHSRKEREIAELVYRDEINRLPSVRIFEERGWRELLMLSDIVISPIFSVHSELGPQYGKLTIVSQAMGERAWIGENLYAEPEPERINQLIETWIERSLLQRKSVAAMIDTILARQHEEREEHEVHVEAQG
jgi:hypothetical protein